MIRYFFIVNPIAANGRTKRVWTRLNNILKNCAIDYQFAFTKQAGDAILLARHALQCGYNRIIAVGGDGTLNEVVNAFFEHDVNIFRNAALGVLNSGTGGDFCRTIALHRNPVKALPGLLNASPHYVDVGSISYVDFQGKTKTRYFINIADAGIGAATAHRVNKTSKFLGGFLSFLQAAVYTIFTYNPKHIKVTVDEKTLTSGNPSIVVVANGRYFAGGMHVAPEARLDDAQLDIIYVNNRSRIQLLHCLAMVYRGKHINHPCVLTHKGHNITLESTDKVLLEAEGEVLGFLPAKFSIIPKALQVIY
ncbi:MAG: diacylglycerol kinase family lipid kinase [Peptococcaceae bacterium]|nr:diacylglycerol kinase family lipid kinase [Peptococcaceae bacterium]